VIQPLAFNRATVVIKDGATRTTMSMTMGLARRKPRA
jgi:hypothetical protein